MDDDKELRALELRFEQRTAGMMSRVVSTSDGPSGSVESLVQIIGCLSDTNQDVVKLLLGSKKHIMGSEELRELLLDYFSCSHKTLEFLNTLHVWLHGSAGVSWRLNRLKSALKDYRSDKTRTGYGLTLLHRAVNTFLGANDPLVAVQLRTKLNAVIDGQKSLCERLQAKQQKMNKTTPLRVYRRVTTAVLASVYIGLMVCAAVTAVLSPAMVAAPLAALATIASMNPTEYMGRFMNHVLLKYEDKIRRRSELINALMEANTRMTLEGLEGIHLLVHDLRGKIHSLSSNFGAAVKLGNDSVVKNMIQDVERNIDEFAKAVKELESRKDVCYKVVMDARKKILSLNKGVAKCHVTFFTIHRSRKCDDYGIPKRDGLCVSKRDDYGIPKRDDFGPLET